MTAGATADAVERAAALIGLFSSPAEFGGLAVVPAGDVPQPYRGLLDHASHMTVAMERHHGGPVGLRVVAERAGPLGSYAREILLTASSGAVVQFGIVRIDLGLLAPETAARVRAGTTPLGRILLESGTLCTVAGVALLDVRPGPHLGGLLGTRPTFGRVAGISVAGRPAVELLEIVAAE